MRNLFIYLGIIMGIVFLVFGVLMFIVPPDMLKDWSPTARMIMGIGIIIYGGFRIYRSIKMLKDSKNFPPNA